MLVYSPLVLILGLASMPDLALAQAQYCMQAKHFEEAATEYKRFIFFRKDSNGPELGDAYFQLGLALRSYENYQESLKAFRMSLECASGKWTDEDKRFALATCLTALGRYPEAEFALVRLETSTASLRTKQRASLLMAVNSFYGHRWDAAHKALQSYVQTTALLNNDGEIVRTVIQYLSSKKAFHPKSRSLAKTLSTLIPGSGQFYAGDWKGGFNALFLNGTFGYLLFSDLAAKNVLHALLGPAFLFKRFYVGNRKNAAGAVELYNDRKNRIMALALLDAISNLHAN